MLNNLFSSSASITLLAVILLVVSAGLRSLLPIAFLTYANKFSWFGFQFPESCKDFCDSKIGLIGLVAVGFAALLEIIIYLVSGIDLIANAFFGNTAGFCVGLIVPYSFIYPLIPITYANWLLLVFSITIALLAIAVNNAALFFRTTLTVGSAGILNPVFSLLETVVAFAACILAVLLM